MSALASPLQTSQRAPPGVLKALAPALLVKSLPASTMPSPLPVLAVSEPLARVMPLPAVGPVLMASMLAALMVRSVMSPLAVWVLPAPSSRRTLTAPLPASMLLPAPMVMSALPLSRCASSTPWAVVSLAISVRLPLSVLMLALIRMDRPACRASAPPLPPGLLALMAVETEMSLLACSVTLVPALSSAVRSLASSLLSVPGVSA